MKIHSVIVSIYNIIIIVCVLFHLKIRFSLSLSPCELNSIARIMARIFLGISGQLVDFNKLL